MYGSLWYFFGEPVPTTSTNFMAFFWGRCWKISEECSLVLAVFQTLNWLGSVCQQIYGVFD
jgi:hypothetical protein